MFKFLKNIFKEEQTTDEINIDTLYKWFDEESMFIINDTNSILKTFNLRIKEEIESTKQNLDILSKAELKNKNVPERMIQMMQGNRQSYIKRVNQFLDNIKESVNYEDYKDNISEINNGLDLLGKSTHKNYYVLQEFFSNESSRIAYNLKKIENVIKEFNERLKEKKSSSVSGIKKKVKELERQLAAKKNLLDNIKKKEDGLDELKNSKKDIIQEIEELKKNEKFLNFEKLKKEREEIIKQIDEHKQKLTHIFSVIGHALKKFQRMSVHENLIKEYLNNSIDAIGMDPGYKIIVILEEMREHIDRKKVDLKDKKKDKTIEYSRKINKEFLKEFIIQHKGLEKKRKNKEQEILANKVIEDYKNLKEKLKNKEEEIDKDSQEFVELKKEYGKFEIDELKDLIERKIKNTLSKDIKIII